MTSEDLPKKYITREYFIQCARGPLRTPFYSEYPNERKIDPERVSKYLDTLSPLTRKFASEWIPKVKYVGFDELYTSIVKSLRKCLDAIDNKEWCVYLPTRRYGSEHWLLQLLFQSELKDKEPKIIQGFNPKTDPIHIVILDDCSYSGGNIADIIDNEVPRDRYHIHIVCPYISDFARDTISSYAPVKGYIINMYPLNGQYIKSPYPWDVTDDDKEYYYQDPDNNQAFLKEEIVSELDMTEVSALVPIFFDHKIASNASTASAILENIVYPLPSRSCIERAEAALISL